MQKVYKLLQIALVLLVALVILWAGFSVLPSVKGMCVSMAPLGVCQLANTCLSALLFFFIAYYTLLWINKLRKNSESH